MSEGEAPDIQKLMENVKLEDDGNFYIEDNGEKVKVNFHTFVPETKMRDYTPDEWVKFRKEQMERMRKIQLDFYMNRLASYNHWLQNNGTLNRNGDGISTETTNQTGPGTDISEREAEDPCSNND